MAYFVEIRRGVDQQADISDLVAAMKENAQYRYDGGMTAEGNPDYAMGLSLYLEGDHEKGLALIAKAVDLGHRLYNLPINQLLLDDPGFAPIPAAYDAMKKRERHKVLTVVCNNNPYADVWQPEEGTCEQFLSVQGNQSR